MKEVFLCLGREFITLSCEGKEGMTATDQSREIFRSLDEELRGMGLSLENTVRTRLWGKDRKAEIWEAMKGLGSCRERHDRQVPATLHRATSTHTPTSPWTC